ncbi:hypothetical protein [Pedobacter sp.]|jgi:SdpC family antimicrobial peptide|uniref:hypothetical protein n=1 Tax=Pedobacter sp. TaxID=1411316 RepID=UPI002CD894ED|nr:hypothetical protein [Pedobacter sp.]HWW41939.1 hypothetical protein [Pedobacter sp.]
MEKIRNLARKWYITIPMASIIFYASCKKSDSSTNVKTGKEYTGEEIFKALYFGDGKATALVSDYVFDFKNAFSDTDAKYDIEKVENEILNKIKGTDKDFFEKFGTEIKSGNVGRVKNALKTATTAMRKSLDVDSKLQDLKVNGTAKQELLVEFKQDGGYKLKSKEVVNLLNTDKYKSLLRKVFNVKDKHASAALAAAAEDETEDLSGGVYYKNTNIYIHRQTFVYLWVAAVGGAVALVAIFVEQSPVQDTPVPNLDVDRAVDVDIDTVAVPVPENRAQVLNLRGQEFVATIANAFSK